jgi:hypothetical protein
MDSVRGRPETRSAAHEADEPAKLTTTAVCGSKCAAPCEGEHGGSNNHTHGRAAAGGVQELRSRPRASRFVGKVDAAEKNAAAGTTTRTHVRRWEARGRFAFWDARAQNHIPRVVEWHAASSSSHQADDHATALLLVV